MYLLNDILSLLWKNEEYEQNLSLKDGSKNRLAAIDSTTSWGVPRFLFRSLSSIDARSTIIAIKCADDFVPFYQTNKARNVEFTFPSLETPNMIEKCRQLRKSVSALTQPINVGKTRFPENRNDAEKSRNSGNLIVLLSLDENFSLFCY